MAIVVMIPEANVSVLSRSSDCIRRPDDGHSASPASSKPKPGLRVVTVVKEGGFEIAIYANDHPPPHAHVFHGAGEARIEIRHRVSGQPRVLTTEDMNKADIRRARDLVGRHADALMRAWENYHG